MRTLLGLAALAPDRFRRPVVTVGMFDGLHRGHLHVLEHLHAFAQRLRGEPVVLTFDTHPLAVIAGAPPRRILSPAHRLLLLERLGVAATVVLPFDPALRELSYERFVTDVLVARMGLAGLLFGYNANFGKDGAGTADSVRPLGVRLGFDVSEAPAITLGDCPISSSRIRDAIQAGDFATAREMLGRPVALYGRVVAGEGRGRRLGFPTANLDLEGELLPPRGVYVVVLVLDGRRHPALANVGVRPTFTPAGAPAEVPLVEVHVPGLERDLYGLRLEVELVRRLRDERRFPSLEALQAQIASDLEGLRAAPPA